MSSILELAGAQSMVGGWWMVDRDTLSALSSLVTLDSSVAMTVRLVYFVRVCVVCAWRCTVHLHSVPTCI